MKKIILLILLFFCQVSFSQAKKKAVPPPIKKGILAPPKIVRTEDLPVSKIVSILRKNDFPMAFKFEVNKDTTILPDQEFAEIIEVSGDSYSESLSLTMISRTAADTIRYESNSDTKFEKRTNSYYETRNRCDGVVSKETIKATDKETKLTTSFKAVFDKPKKKILYLINVSNGRKYLLAAYEPPPPSIGF